MSENGSLFFQLRIVYKLDGNVNQVLGFPSPDTVDFQHYNSNVELQLRQHHHFSFFISQVAHKT